MSATVERSENQGTGGPSYILQNATFEQNSYDSKARVGVSARYAEMRGRLMAAYSVRDNWDGYGSRQPRTESRDNLRAFVEDMYDKWFNMTPTCISPIVDGGLGAIYENGASRAVLEFHNSGDLVCLLENRKKTVLVERHASSETAVIALAKEVRDFLKNT